jgi:hypothetical protein
VHVYLDPPPGSAATADPPVRPDGTFDTKLRVPYGAPFGPYRLIACQICDPVEPGSFFADSRVQVMASVLTLSPPSAAAGDVATASGEAWNPDLGEVYLFAAESTFCDRTAALATAMPDKSFVFSVALTVPPSRPGPYQFMAAQCDGGEVIARALAPFTITPPRSIASTTPSRSGSTSPSTSLSTSSASSTSSANSTSVATSHAASTPPTSAAVTSPPSRPTPPAPASTTVPLTPTSSKERYTQLGWIVLAVLSTAFAVLATRFLVRGRWHAGRPPVVDAQLDYRPACAPEVAETLPKDRHDIRLLTSERYGSVLSTEERG